MPSENEIRLELNKVFSKSVNGVYQPYQPIYGLWKDSQVRNKFPQSYIITREILLSLTRLEFSSCLDVGGAEGYTSARVREFFHVNVVSAELSDVACKRAKDIFNLRSVSANPVDLPFRDGAFDVVLCSETLEHIVNKEKTLSELLRVAKKAVIITVPYKERLEHSQQHGSGHQHRFDENSLNSVAAKKVVIKKFASSLTRWIARPSKGLRWKALITFFVRLDGLFPFKQNNILFMIVKQGELKQEARIPAYKVVDFEVKFHHI